MRKNSVNTIAHKENKRKTFVDVVVPPEVTEQMVGTCRKLEITKVWMQPGSESEKAIKFCEENGINIVYGVCVTIQRRVGQSS